MTEAGPALFHTSRGETLEFHIGYPLPGVKIKSDGTHTLWFQSPGQCSFRKSFHDAVWQAMEDQWISTGDIILVKSMVGNLSLDLSAP